jgi:hypothetical protein
MRAIDGDTLRKGLNNAIAQVTANTGVRGLEREAFLETMVFVLRMIDQAETLDVAPVVRCRECKHRNKEEICPLCWIEWHPEDEHCLGYAEKHDDAEDDGFCHYGAKMDGGIE